MNRNKITIIITWYCKWPDYLPIFLKGNELNTLNLQNLKILNY